MERKDMIAGLTKSVDDIAKSGDLRDYATQAAAQTLVENWLAALNDGGHPLEIMVGDVDIVIASLGDFKAKVMKMAGIVEPASDAEIPSRPRM